MASGTKQKKAKKETASKRAATWVEAGVAALREDVEALRRDVRLQGESLEALVGLLREFPRAATAPAPAKPVDAPAGIPASGSHDVAEAAVRLSAARSAIRQALATLPRDHSYATAADHLRELATVSPSLMAWMEELPTLTMPLGDAIASLEEAVRELDDADRSLRRLAEPVPTARHK